VPKTSDHKQAVQTAQRALSEARKAKAIAASGTEPPWWKSPLVGALVALIFGAAAFSFSRWPRIDIELLDSHFTADRPFPDSIKITNSGGSNLEHVSVKMRICGATSDDQKGKIIGRKEGQSCAGPTGGRGGIAHSTWSNHKLERGESWPLPIASDPNFAFTMNVGRADVSAYVEYWPSMLPGFLPIFWTERRFTTALDRDGRPIWRAIPLD
jgi:hypothetical protein